jgi:FkbM family methyltransferase
MNKPFTRSIRAILDWCGRILSFNKTITTYLFSHSLRNELIEYIDTEYFSRYVHIEKSVTLLKSVCPSRKLIIDVGGADGTTAALFLDLLPGSDIIIFEPLQENINQIKSRFQLNKRVTLIEKAAGSVESTATIYHAERITSSSLFPLHQEKTDSIFSNILNEKGSSQIPVTTIDAVVKPNAEIGIVKLDVQGYELEVLKGGTRSLGKTAFVVTEVNNHSGYIGAPKYFEIDAFLRDHRFTLFDIFPSTKDHSGQLKEWDAIYINTSLL